MPIRALVAAALACALGGCADYAALCAANDPSVDAATCWRKGWSRGVGAGESDAYDVDYEAGYAACVEDNGYAR